MKSSAREERILADAEARSKRAIVIARTDGERHSVIRGDGEKAREMKKGERRDENCRDVA